MNPQNQNQNQNPRDFSNHDPHGSDLPPLERLHELLADRAVFGLTHEETAELEALLVHVPPAHRDDLDLLAADLARSFLPVEHEPLPAHLAAKVLRDAHEEVGPGKIVSIGATPPSPADGHPPAASAPKVEPLRPEDETVPGTQAAEDASRRRWFLNMLTAIAAGVLVAVSLGRQMLPAPSPTPTERRKSLLAAAADSGGGDVLRLDWTATADPAAKGASGDVVWSGTAQEGYMLFRGLAANVPTREQYQLWVFDADRDERYPVDGGVFDVPAGAAEVVVPITARLPVKKATLFAITVERPGGVVVSDRKRLPLLAKAPAG